MNWLDRITRAEQHGAFSHEDLVAAFNRKESLIAEFGFATDEWGVAHDGYAARLSDAFGWMVLSNEFAKARRIVRAMEELAKFRRNDLAA